MEIACLRTCRPPPAGALGPLSALTSHTTVFALFQSLPRKIMMTAIFVALLLFGVAPVFANNAPVIKSNPSNAVAVADFPSGGTHLPTKGYVYFWSPEGKEVQVHVDMTGLPQTGGPFVYHIHDHAIINGDCESAGLHFNPYGAATDCAAQQDDSYCQVGDLSGKHGWINTTCFQTSYEDPYLSLGADSPSHIVGKSVVFHYADLTKFACALIGWANDEQMAAFKELDLAPVKSDKVSLRKYHHLEEDDTVPINETYALNWTNATKLSHESCSQVGGASGVRSALGLVLGAVFGALL